MADTRCEALCTVRYSSGDIFDGTHSMLSLVYSHILVPRPLRWQTLDAQPCLQSHTHPKALSMADSRPKALLMADTRCEAVSTLSC
jgi:hypothetical protein